jgi:O-antigen/teichoic acid export membrane protein
MGAEGAEIVPLLAAGMTIASIKSYYLDVVFQLQKATRHQAFSAAIMAFTNLVANLVLIPALGVQGAAVAAVISFSAGASYSIVVGRRLRPRTRLHGDLFRTVLATGSMAAVLALLDEPKDAIALMFCIATGVIVYLAAAIAMNVMGLRDFVRSSIARR